MHLFSMGNGLLASRNSVRITVRNNCPEATGKTPTSPPIPSRCFLDRASSLTLKEQPQLTISSMCLLHPGFVFRRQKPVLPI